MKPKTKPRATQQGSTLVKNRMTKKYTIQEKYVAGIVLEGWEVKSIKRGQADISRSSIDIKSAEAWLYGVYIAAKKSSFGVTDINDFRPHKLLLTKRELTQLAVAKQQNKHLLPVSLFVRHGYIKVQVGVATIRKKSDKRDKIRRQEDAKSIADLNK